MEHLSWMSEHGARYLIDQLQDGIFVIENGKMIYVNLRMAQMLGNEVSELIGTPFIKFVAPDDQALVMERYNARLSGETVPEQYEIRLRTAQGSLIFCSLNVNLKVDENGHTSTIGSARDITRQKAELAELETSRSELKSIFDHLPDVFYRTDMQGVITLISPSCYELVGYRQEVLLGTHMADYYQTPEERQKIVQAITEGKGKATSVEAALRHKDGTIVWISTSALVRLDDDGKPMYIEGIARDISDRKLMEEQLTLLTQIDSLTGTYSRSYFMDKCDKLFTVMKRYHRPASMMMMDLDNFKMINDTYGHHVGDLALIAFTLACQKEIREADILGRLGGEEFGLMLPETNLNNAQAMAERIRKRIEEIEIPFAGYVIKITVSIGLIELCKDEQTLDDALRCADRAMYQAKDKGRNRVVIYQNN